MADHRSGSTATDDSSEGAAVAAAPSGYLSSSRSLFNAIVMATPLFVAYQIGVLFTEGWKNGADFVTPKIYDLVGHSRGLYLLVNALILVALLVAGRLVKGPLRLRRSTWVLTLMEAAAYASVLGTLILWIMDAIGVDPRLALSLSTADQIVLSFGAGAYEELVFRLLLFGGLLWVGRHLGLKTAPTFAAALIVSSALFAAAHHPPFGGDPWALDAFTYRFIAGLLFAGLFRVRGFAVAAYTHAFYDVFVLVSS